MWKKHVSHYYTTKPELERSGMGFTIMENFMDEVEVHSSQVKEPRLDYESIYKTAKCYAIKETCQWMWRLRTKRVKHI